MSRLLPEFSRRGVIAGAAATAACHRGVLQTVPAAGQGLPFADAHAHFFNLADLPVGGFVTYVLVGRIFPPPPWGEAMIDFVSGFAKRFASSARQEAGGHGGTGTTLDAAGFGRAADAYVQERLSAVPAASAEADALVQSYAALLEELSAQTGLAPPGEGLEVPAAAIDTRRSAFTRAALAQDADDNVVAATAGGVDLLGVAGEVSRTIGWVYLMVRSRRSHIERYLARQISSDRRPREIVSLLVDYDYWLDDRPATGSSQMDQIRTMDLLRRDVADRADIRLFAGVCPLRLAIQRASKQPALFDAITGALAGGQVHGFKLYPPMGFRPSGNGELGNSDFDPKPGRRRTAWDCWREETGITAPGSLGNALDRALDEIYGFAAARGVPIIAHAGPGNGAAKGFGERANPKYWEQVVKGHPIRLSLGHLVNDAGPFVSAVLYGSSPVGVWALDASSRMLNRNQDNPPDVYGDIAYMPELNDPDCCAEFFRALAKAFTPGDPKLERILYGTDWIMYAREARSDRYLLNVEKGMRAARYTGEQVDNILWNNARRFLAVR